MKLRILLVNILVLSLISACARSKAATQPVQQATAILKPSLPVFTETRYPAQPTTTIPVVPTSESSFQDEEPDFDIVLTALGQDSITISILSQQDAQVIIQYSLAGDAYSMQASPVQVMANEPLNVRLSGLTTDTPYQFRLVYNGKPSTAHAFHTPRSPGSSYTFTIDADPHFGDPQFNGQLYANTLANALQDKPDFHINLGDTFMTEKAQPKSIADAESTFSGMRQYLSLLTADVPLFLVNGNHEGELGWLANSGKDREVPAWSAALRREYFPGLATGASGNDTYYSWSWGDALFVVLDPFQYTTQKPRGDEWATNWNWTLGKVQYDWLHSTLENSQQKYKFVFIHHLVGGAKDARGGIEVASYFEWGGNNPDGTYGFDQNRPGWEVPIHRLLVENHVNAVFHGHDHVFVQQELNGIIYQEVPQPSIANYKNTRLATDYGYTNGVVISSAGHLKVTVTPSGTTVEYIRSYLPEHEQPGRLNRQVDYSYTIR